jgi:hypothetical protein
MGIPEIFRQGTGGNSIPDITNPVGGISRELVAGVKLSARGHTKILVARATTCKSLGHARPSLKI